ncbi:MAG: glycosyltransferase family 39 protein [Rhodobacter sp.]|nr:glycosyltransferase family 39 protein [Rhodobacter sp.]
MPSAAVPVERGWLWPAAWAVLAVTAARVVLLAFNRTDLFVDEAQYWLWGQELAFGYYSKPPMIGWVIRFFTEIGGDGAFWIRLPGPLLHAASALILGAVAARVVTRQAAFWVALGYVTLPMVAVGSLLISTDTVMFPFLAAALLGYLRVLERGEAWVAVLTGAALGLAFLSKYAALYYLISAALAGLLLPSARPGWRAAGLALAGFLAVASPNLIWNLANGLTTVQHTLDNADWVRDPGARAGLNYGGLTAFVASQFAVLGPVLFAAFLSAALRWRRAGAEGRLLLMFSLPILAAVCVQALLSQAYANWAASAYLAGTVLAVAVVLRRRVWLAASFAVNGALCLLFPLAAVAPEALVWRGQPLLERYIGRDEMSQAILAAAEARGLTTIVAGDRDVLADLFYTARDLDVVVASVPPKGRPQHHYAQRFPYRPGTEEVLLVLRASDRNPCPDLTAPVGDIAPKTGAYRRHPQALFVAMPECFGS